MKIGNSLLALFSSRECSQVNALNISKVRFIIDLAARNAANENACWRSSDERIGDAYRSVAGIYFTYMAASPVYPA